MNRVLDFIAFKAPLQQQVYFILAVVSVLYLFNFHVNDIWTPNESFYAEAVREMYESDNFLEIKYNYEPRYNKPPLTYWAIAASVGVFGMNEFGIRLPIVLMAIGAIWFTYLLGKQLYGQRGGLYAMVMMAFSVQLLAVKQYASPEIPLTFFFTATMYYFIKGFMDREAGPLYLSYVMLGFSVLTKGFPYIIVAAAIIGLYILTRGPLTWRRIWDDIKFMRLPIGIPIMLLIGLSWVIFMYLKDGQEFWEVYYRETFGRAFSKKTNGPQPFFYLEVISWSILPYSLAFFFALIKWVKDRADFKKVLFPFCWFICMFVIFTSAKGKIPTYMIQAHPAMLLMIVPLLLEYRPGKKIWELLWSFVFLFPAVLILAANVALIYLLNMHWAFYAVPILSVAMLAYFHFQKAEDKNPLLAAAPFWVIFGLLVCFGAFLPQLEQFRPYDELGEALAKNEAIAPDTPVMIEATLIHNIPFYTRRFAERDQTPEQIQAHAGPTLALVRDTSLDALSGFETIWSGMIYDFPSESQFAKFIAACVEAQEGDLSKFALYHLVYRK